MSETRDPTDVEVSRCLNAVVVTLNDRRVGSAHPDEVQTIVTGALGGEQAILARAGGGADALELTAVSGQVLARITRADDRWIGERVGAPLTGGYIPSSSGAQP